jgi:uncharacterized protein (DUF2225 family)
LGSDPHTPSFSHNQNNQAINSVKLPWLSLIKMTIDGNMNFAQDHKLLEDAELHYHLVGAYSQNLRNNPQPIG